MFLWNQLFFLPSPRSRFWYRLFQLKVKHNVLNFFFMKRRLLSWLRQSVFQHIRDPGKKQKTHACWLNSSYKNKRPNATKLSCVAPYETKILGSIVVVDPTIYWGLLTLICSILRRHIFKTWASMKGHVNKDVLCSRWKLFLIFLLCETKNNCYHDLVTMRVCFYSVPLCFSVVFILCVYIYIYILGYTEAGGWWIKFRM